MNVGLVPMAAKPYHKGHHALVEKAAADNDKVLLFVSASDRIRKGELPISGSDMMKIWKEQIEPILPSNVIPVYGGSPVRKVYEELERADTELSEDIFTVYSDPVDTARNYSEKARLKSFPSLYQRGNVLFIAEEDPGSVTRGEGTPDVSGTAMRHALQTCDIEAFRIGMPSGIDVEGVYNTLCQKRHDEGYLRYFVASVLKG